MNQLNNVEALNEFYKSSYVKKLQEAYDPYLQTVAKNKTNFNEDQSARLAIMLSNVETQLMRDAKKYEGTQVNDIGMFKKHAMALISATMPNLIAEDIVSIQPLMQKVGQIFFMKYLYGTSRNGINAGDTMFDRFGSPKYNENYTNEIITDEEIGTGDGSTKAFEGFLAFTPVRPSTVAITAGSVKIADDGNGTLIGTGVTGTVDYSTGRVTITFSTAPEDSVTIDADYDYDLEFAPSTIPQIQLKVEETTVKARPRKLRALYSFDSGYDLKVSQGVDIDASLLEASVAEIRTEMDAEFLLDLYKQAGATTSWNRYYDPSTYAYSKHEFDLQFLDSITSAGNQMFQDTRRILPNILVVGKEAGDILDCIGAPRYQAVAVSNPNGPHYAGTLDGRIKVYKNPYFASNQYLLAYKGNNILDAGYIYAPYLPIYSSQLLMLDDFVARRGFATSYGKKMVNNKCYIAGTITNTKPVV